MNINFKRICKIVSYVLLIIFMLLCIKGYYDESKSTVGYTDSGVKYKRIKKERFCILNEYDDGYEVYDKQTKEMYFVYDYHYGIHGNQVYLSGIVDLHKTYENYTK